MHSVRTLWTSVHGDPVFMRIEVEQKRQQREREENPTEKRVVEALIQQTTIDPVVDAVAR